MTKEIDDIVRLRAQIDAIDAAMLDLLAKRRDIALEIAKNKQTAGKQEDEKRVVAILDNIEEEANKRGLDGRAVRDIWRRVIMYMIEEQMKTHPY